MKRGRQQRERFKLGVAAGVAWAAVAACAPEPTAVRVDLNAILSRAPIAAAPEPDLPRPPLPMAARTMTMTGFPAGYLVDPSDTKPDDVEAAIEWQQQRARIELERRLLSVYREEIRQARLDAERTADGLQASTYLEADRKIRDRFQVYADQRVPLAARLYDLVGFPDPNPTNGPPRSPLGKVSQQRFDEAAAVRTSLAAVESDYQRDKEAILARAAQSIEAGRAEIMAKLRAQASEMERRALETAARLVRTSAKDLGLQLTDSRPVPLPPTSDQVVTLPAEAPFLPPPQVPSNGIPTGKEDRRQRVQRELTIWLGVHRYRLAPNGRDATAEFRRWRESFQAGQ